MIGNVGLLIGQYNEDETLDKARTHIEELGLSCFTSSHVLSSSEDGRDLSKEHTFVFTDDRTVADLAASLGIGFGVYLNDKSRSASFPEALYSVDEISSLPLLQIDRMLLRHLKLPWQILETKRCIIREIIVEDVDTLYEIYGEDATAFQYAGELYEDPEEEKQYTKDYIDHQYRFCEYGIWIVIDKATGKIIGRAGLDRREGYEYAELGFVFAISYRHKGYAYEVCSAILSYAKEQLGMSALNAFTIRQNHDSVRLLKRLGFHFEDTAVLFGKEHDRYFIELSHR